MTPLRRPPRGERGSALVTAVTVVGVMLMFGMPLLEMIDSTQRRTTTERVRETTYNVAEAAMAAQTRALTASWPHQAADALPSACTRAATSPLCPSAAVLAQDFAASDFDAASDWSVEVRDNVESAATYYSRPLLESTACAGLAPCTWDSNGDGMMWVRAGGTIRGRTRSVISLVRQQIVRIPIPRTVITAGKVATSNMGRKTIIDSKGCHVKHNPTATCNTTQPAPLVVRCSTGPAPGDPCLSYQAEQVAPNLYSQDPATPDLLTPVQLEQVRAFAIQAGTYRNTCPTTAAEMAGAVVFVEPAAAAASLTCSLSANAVVNSPEAPGVFVINRGTISISGNLSFYGVVYAANNLPSPADSGFIVNLQGGAYIQGGVIVGGAGGVMAGSSGVNISFDENAFGGLKGVSGTAAVVQSSYRELPNGQ